MAKTLRNLTDELKKRFRQIPQQAKQSVGILARSGVMGPGAKAASRYTPQIGRNIARSTTKFAGQLRSDPKGTIKDIGATAFEQATRAPRKFYQQELPQLQKIRREKGAFSKEMALESMPVLSLLTDPTERGVKFDPTGLGAGVQTAATLYGAPHLNPMGLATSVGIGTTITAATGGDIKQGIGSAMGRYPATMGVVRATDPAIYNELVKRGLQRGLTSRVASSVANIAQGVLIDKTIDLPTDVNSVMIDAALGFAMGSGQFKNAGLQTDEIVGNDDARTLTGVYKKMQNNQEISIREQGLVDDILERNLKIPKKDLKIMSITDKMNEVRTLFSKNQQYVFEELPNQKGDFGMSTKPVGDVLEAQRAKGELPREVREGGFIDVSSIHTRKGLIDRLKQMGASGEEINKMSKPELERMLGNLIESRPMHQLQLEAAAREGDFNKMAKILDSIPDNDPYKSSMESIFRPRVEQNAQSGLFRIGKPKEEVKTINITGTDSTKAVEKAELEKKFGKIEPEFERPLQPISKGNVTRNIQKSQLELDAERYRQGGYTQLGPKIKGDILPDKIAKIQAENEARVRPEQISKHEIDQKLTESVLREDSPEGFEKLVRKYLGGKNIATTEGGEIGYKYRELLKDLPKDEGGFVKFMNQVQGVEKSSDPTIARVGAEWKQDTDALYGVIKEQADRVGLDMGYVDNYAPQFWDLGDPKTKAAFEVLSRSNPSFRSKFFENYQEGLDSGMKLKYTDPARVMAEYTKRLYITKNNLDLFEQLRDNNMIVEGAIARGQRGFEAVKAPGFPKRMVQVEGKVVEAPYYAPSDIAKKINKIFTEQNYSKKLKFAADASKRFQNVSLSGGTPKAPINAFYAAQVQKEMLSGNVGGSLKVFATATSPKARTKYMLDNSGLIKEMQANNALSSTGITPSMLGKAEGAGDAWDRVMTDPTFKWGMPMLQMEHYKKIKSKALKKGLSEIKATDVASQSVRNFYGLIDPYKQVMGNADVENAKNVFLFAPYYREAMINFWKNNVKAFKNPLALENRQNLKFVAGAALTYGVMSGLNQMLNGHSMSENPENKKDKLLIPVGDKTIGVPFLSSIATVPRGLVRIGSGLVKGDYEKAATDTFQTFASMGIKPLGDIASNEDYFGRPIYDENGTAKEKHTAVMKYLGKQALAHPWVKSLIEYVGEDEERDALRVAEAISTAGELPFRFYDTDKILNSPFWEEYNQVKGLSDRYRDLKKDNPAKAEIFYVQHQEELESLPQMQEALDAYFDEGDAAALIEYMGGDVPTYEQSEDAPQTSSEKALLHIKSGIANPIQTVQAVSNQEPIRKIRPAGPGITGFFGSSTVTERQRGLSELDQGDTSTQVDHIVPKWIGGREKKENYQLLTNEEHRKKSTFEDELRERYEAGDISRKKALKEIDDFNSSLNPQLVPEALAKEELEVSMSYVDGLEAYSSGNGKKVVDRADWAEMWLKNSKNESEFKSWYNDMLKSGVMTKSVLEELRERGLKLDQYTQAGRIKTLGSSSRGRKIPKVTIKKVTVKPTKIRRSPKTVSVKFPKTPHITKPRVRAIKITGGVNKVPQYKIKPFKNTLTSGFTKLV